MKKICYNCGIELNETNATVEHVPAKALYEGLDDKFRNNRITVPACHKCNHQYSKIDQEIRDALAIRKETKDNQEKFIGKGVRSILRRQNWKERVHLNEKGEVIAVNFSYSDLRQIHIKNFKALFLRKYGFPIPSNFEIEIIADGDEDKIDRAQTLYHYLIADNVVFEVSGHSEIFKFIIKDITPDTAKNNIYESGDFDKLVAVVGLLVYHDDLGVIIVAGKKDYIESCKPTSDKS